MALFLETIDKDGVTYKNSTLRKGELSEDGERSLESFDSYKKAEARTKNLLQQELRDRENLKFAETNALSYQTLKNCVEKSY